MTYKLSTNFLLTSSETLQDISSMLDQRPALALADLPASNTALLIVDMVNGFAKEGALYSPRIAEVIQPIRELMVKTQSAGIKSVVFTDYHPANSPEYDAFPVHCLAGTAESSVVRELQEVGHYDWIRKNSTNGYLEEDFQKWLATHDVNHFIIVGDCTDICIMQLALTLKTHFNRLNRASRIIVPLNAVETYDLGSHSAELANVMALYFMHNGGVEIARAIV